MEVCEVSGRLPYCARRACLGAYPGVGAFHSHIIIGKIATWALTREWVLTRDTTVVSSGPRSVNLASIGTSNVQVKRAHSLIPLYFCNCYNTAKYPHVRSLLYKLYSHEQIRIRIRTCYRPYMKYSQYSARSHASVTGCRSPRLEGCMALIARKHKGVKWPEG